MQNTSERFWEISQMCFASIKQKMKYFVFLNKIPYFLNFITYFE